MKNISYYVLNLDKDTERLKKILEKFKKNNISVNRVPGIYGKNQIPEYLYEFIDENMINFQPPGLIGCGLTHIKAYLKFINESNNEYGVFFEDDADFDELFYDKFINLIDNEVPKNFDILYLGAFIGNKIDKRYKIDYSFMRIYNLKYIKKVKKISENIFVPSIPLALHAYVLSRKQALFLIENFKKDKLINHIDIQMLKYNYNKNSYSVSPNLVIQDSIDVNTSTNSGLKFPKSLNKILLYKDEDGIPLNYKLSLPHYELLGIPVNGYTYLFITFSFIIGLVYDTKTVSKLLIFFYIIDTTIVGEIEKNTFLNFLLIFILSIISSLIARSMYKLSN
jgi:GR25 family glycosyltransferase involved in LPS biosynthesis